MQSIKRSLIPALALAVAAGACASSGGSGNGGEAGAPEAQAAETVVKSQDRIPESSEVLRPAGAVEVREAPAATARVIATLAPHTELGSARALLVVQRQGEWVEVFLPIRPNGATGWVHAAGFDTRTVDTAVVVDLDTRTLTFYRGGTPTLQTAVAVGSPENPTPTGRFFVTDFVESTNPGGAYGPFAYGLSGHSETLSEFAGGDGQIGIHGTNDAASIGNAVSHGCVRVPNDVIRRLAEMTPLGTPVLIA